MSTKVTSHFNMRDMIQLRGQLAATWHLVSAKADEAKLLATISVMCEVDCWVLQWGFGLSGHAAQRLYKVLVCAPQCVAPFWSRYSGVAIAMRAKVPAADCHVTVQWKYQISDFR